MYGSAGTGKSTLINHIAHFFADKRKLFLAQTNPAVDNLKRRVTASNCTFSTITKFLKRQSIITDYDLLIIDECSTVNNRDMRDILTKGYIQTVGFGRRFISDSLYPIWQLVQRGSRICSRNLGV